VGNQNSVIIIFWIARLFSAMRNQGHKQGRKSEVPMWQEVLTRKKGLIAISQISQNTVFQKHATVCRGRGVGVLTLSQMHLHKIHT